MKFRVQVRADGNILQVRVREDTGDDVAPALSWLESPLDGIRNVLCEALRAQTVAAPVGLPNPKVISLEFGTAGLAESAVNNVQQIVESHLPA